MNTSISTFAKYIFLSFLILSSTHQIHAIVPTPIETVVKKDVCTSTMFAPLTFSELSVMSKQEVEAAVNRKLKFKERRSLRAIHKMTKRLKKLGLPLEDDVCEQLDKKSQAALVIGIIGLFIAGLILGIIAIVNASRAQRLARANPDCPDAAKLKSKANVGLILGIVDVIGGILVISFLL